jgi:hypothetical protein
METTTQSGTPAGAGKSSLNPDALNELLGQMVNDLGAAVNGALVVLGDGLGIYAALADIGPATSQKLAEKTNLNERQLRDTSVMTRRATPFFSLLNRPRCLLIRTVQRRW